MGCWAGDKWLQFYTLVGLSSLNYQHEVEGHTRNGQTSARRIAYTVEYAYNMQHHCSNAGHADRNDLGPKTIRTRTRPTSEQHHHRSGSHSRGVSGVYAHNRVFGATSVRSRLFVVPGGKVVCGGTTAFSSCGGGHYSRRLQANDGRHNHLRQGTATCADSRGERCDTMRCDAMLCYANLWIGCAIQGLSSLRLGWAQILPDPRQAVPARYSPGLRAGVRSVDCKRVRTHLDSSSRSVSGGTTGPDDGADDACGSGDRG